MFYSVFEQFELIGGSLYTLKPFLVSMVGILGFLVVIDSNYKLSRLVSVGYVWLIKSQYNMLNSMQSVVGQGYGKFMLILYLFIISLNVCGLIPFSYALTSQLAVTLYLGLGQ